MLPHALRKAAILISTLDERTAEALLAQMDAEQAAQVRSAIVELEEISGDEEERVLAEFMRQQDSSALARALKAGDSDVELELSSVHSDEPERPAVSRRPEPLGSECPWQFMESIVSDQLARVLCCEQPQTIAAVIAQLPPEQSAGVLQHLPAQLATESLERMATIEPLAPAVQADLERELKRRLAGQGYSLTAKSDSARRVSAVLSAMDFRQRERALLQLSRHNSALVQQLGLHPAASDWEAAGVYRVTSYRYRLARPDQPESARQPAKTPALSFGDLASLDEHSLREVFAAAEPAVALLALTGADESLLSRVMRQLPAKDAAVLRQRLEHPGPVRLREIEQAQAQLAAVATDLAREGTIRLPPSARFAAAA